jgi:hypothetical protein
MNSVSGLADNSIESVVVVGGVMDGSGGTVGLHQAVVPLHIVTNSLLSLLLDVPSVLILNSVLELVLRRSLGKECKFECNGL